VVHNWVEKRGKGFADDKEVDMEVRMWLVISVGGGCQERNVSSRFEYHIFYVLYPFVTYLLTLPRNCNLLSFCFM
jgi:hypothetical protein